MHESALAADALERDVVGAAAVDVDGDDGARARRDRGSTACGDSVRRCGLNVGEHHGGAREAHGVGGGDEGEVGDDDLVARADAEGHQRERDRGGAARYRDAVASADARGDACLELARQRAVVEEIAVEHVGEARQLAARHLRLEPRDEFAADLPMSVAPFGRHAHDGRASGHVARDDGAGADGRFAPDLRFGSTTAWAPT